MHTARTEMGYGEGEQQDRVLERYSRLEEQFHILGGWAAEAEAGSIASSLGLPDRVLTQPLGTLSGGQRRRVELARVLFSGAPTLILDEPTNHLDADSIAWLRNFLRSHDGGLMVISHDGDLLDSVVNKVSISTPPGPSSTCTASDGSPISSSWPPTSAGGVASAPTQSARS